MNRPVLYSALLHLGIFILMTVGLYNPFSRTLAEQKPIMIEFVNIDEISQAPILAPLDVQEPDTPPNPEPIEEPEIKEEINSEPLKQEAIPAPQQEQKETTPAETKVPQPDPIAEPIPDPKPKIEEKKDEKHQPPKEIIEKKKEEKVEKKQDKVEINLDKKKEQNKTIEDNKKDKKKIDDDFDALLNNVTKENKKDRSSKKNSGKIKGAPADKVGDVVTASEIDAIHQKISRCWIVPNGARDVQDLIVDVDMKIAKDGTVIEAKISDKARIARDPRFRAAAESAQRAVLDPRCNPLPLNPEKYEQWKDLTLSFNPEDMY